MRDNSAKSQGVDRERRGVSRFHALLCYAILIAMSGVFLIPLGWSISTSLKSTEEVYSGEMHWIPQPIMWRNYRDAVNAIPFFTYLKNSVLVTGLTIMGVVISSTLVAFAFGCISWPGRDFLFLVMLATMMLPGQVTMIPVFILFCKLHWVDTLYPLTVPAFLGGSAVFVFLLRQFYLTLPQDLFDAARIDGCGSFGMYWRIVLPLSKPALATVIIFTLNGTWNDFMGPLIYLTSDEHKTLALGLQAFTAQTGSEWSQLMAISTVMIIPILVVFFLGQRYFIEGITLTGLKG